MRRAWVIGGLAVAAVGAGVIWSAFDVDDADLSVQTLSVILGSSLGTQMVQDGDHLSPATMGTSPHFFVEAIFENVGTEPSAPGTRVACHVDVLDPSGTIPLREMSFGISEQLGPSKTQRIFDDLLPKRETGNVLTKTRYVVRCEANEDRSAEETSYANNSSTLEFFID
jgi:hypothetical protein